MKRADDAAPFVRNGLDQKAFFRHEVLTLSKAYPGTRSLLAQCLPMIPAEGAAVQLNLYSPELDEIHDPALSSQTLNWHQQQLGKPGLIAAAGAFSHGSELWVVLMQSDVLERLRDPGIVSPKTKDAIETRFGHWQLLLVNATLDFAVDQRLDTVFFPAAPLIQSVGIEQLDANAFDQLSNLVCQHYQCVKCGSAGSEYWRLDLQNNLGKIIRLESVTAAVKRKGKVICIYHDIEEDADTCVPKGDCRRDLLRMLEIERASGVNATYNILGRLFAQKEPIVRNFGAHSLAFHTYDHDLQNMNQLPMSRRIDPRIKGYRPAQSIMTSELSDQALSFFDFEWLMSWEGSIGCTEPNLVSGIVRIPATTDDYFLHRGKRTYEQWE